MTQRTSKLTEGRFQLAFENSPMGMAIVDFDYRLRRVNKALCTALGYDADELLKRKFTEITHPDDVQRDQVLADQLFRGDIPSYRLEKRFITKEGTVAWLDLTALLVRTKRGKPLYGLAMVDDITDRKSSQQALRTSEERYRSFVANSSEGIWRLEIEEPIDTSLPVDEQVSCMYKHGYLAECNDAVARMYGYERADDIAGARFGELAEVAQPTTPAALREWVTNNYRLRDWTTEIINAQHGRRWLSISLLGIVVNGMLLRAWGVHTDVTEQRVMTRALEDSHHQLRLLSGHLQAVREKERIDLARELHDSLGQSLTSIKIELSVVQRELGENGSKPGAAVFEKFAEINKQLSDTIRTVKTISTELRPGVLDKFGLAAAIEWQAREFSRRSGIKCEFKAPGVKLNLSPDKSTAFFRILQEGLTNISRHAHATQVKIRLRKGKRAVSMTIIDNGKGITQEQINAPSSLGLLGMRERAESIGGSFSIEGTPQKGTIMCVRTDIADALTPMAGN
ncbi:MAG TPA: PAS domain S-box protein, partial [Pyrinomonadaceae bacterium]|nr:PAS domain S-box protein [Pyrinomonadaceae bacterium]